MTSTASSTRVRHRQAAQLAAVPEPPAPTRSVDLLSFVLAVLEARYPQARVSVIREQAVAVLRLPRLSHLSPSTIVRLVEARLLDVL